MYCVCQKAVAFVPHWIPYAYLGPVGDFLHYLGYNYNTLMRIM